MWTRAYSNPKQKKTCYWDLFSKPIFLPWPKSLLTEFGIHGFWWVTIPSLAKPAETKPAKVLSPAVSPKTRVAPVGTAPVVQSQAAPAAPIAAPSRQMFCAWRNYHPTWCYIPRSSWLFPSRVDSKPETQTYEFYARLDAFIYWLTCSRQLESTAM